MLNFTLNIKIVSLLYTYLPSFLILSLIYLFIIMNLLSYTKILYKSIWVLKKEIPTHSRRHKCKKLLNLFY